MTAATVNPTVATPLAFVVLDEAENVPVAWLLDQVTRIPDTGIAAPLASASCAETVIVAPGVGL